LTPIHDLAWDCGTGSGQAALGLVDYFTHVVASDVSRGQISSAFRNPKIHYTVSSAEKSEIESQSVDLITIGQALHWFKLTRFYPEVRRILKPGGIIAAWCYHLTQITPEIDEILATYYNEIVGLYWSDRVQYVNEHYRTIPFPFDEVTPPQLDMVTHWDLNDIFGYLDSWSSTRAFMENRGYNPIEEIEDQLRLAWGRAEVKRTVHWPLNFKIGKIPIPEQKKLLGSGEKPRI
jgi:SAM-dependent methyltransferase